MAAGAVVRARERLPMQERPIAAAAAKIDNDALRGKYTRRPWAKP